MKHQHLLDQTNQIPVLILLSKTLDLLKRSTCLMTERPFSGKLEMNNDPIFQRSLQDLIKGIRNSKRDPTAFISQAISEIKNELKSTDSFVKSEAVSSAKDSRKKFDDDISVGSEAHLSPNDWI